MAKTSLHIHTRLSRAYLALARLSCSWSDSGAVVMADVLGQRRARLVSVVASSIVRSWRCVSCCRCLNAHVSDSLSCRPCLWRVSLSVNISCLDRVSLSTTTIHCSKLIINACHAVTYSVFLLPCYFSCFWWRSGMGVWLSIKWVVVVGSIPCRCVTKAPRSTQPSIPLWLVNRVPPLLTGVKAGCARLCRAASKIVTPYFGDTP